MKGHLRRVFPGAWAAREALVVSSVLLPQAALSETGTQLLLGSAAAQARHSLALLWPRRINEPKLSASFRVLQGIRYRV